MSNIFQYKYQKKTVDDTAADPSPDKRRKKEKPDTAGKTESFWTRNVKAITFFVCLAVFLAVFGPMSVFRIIEIVEEQRVDGELMHTEDILLLAERREYLTMDQFRAYDGDEQSFSDIGSYYRIRVEDRFLVTVGSETEDGRVSYFSVTHLSSGESIEVMAINFQSEDLKAFLNKP